MEDNKAPKEVVELILRWNEEWELYDANPNKYMKPKNASDISNLVWKEYMYLLSGNAEIKEIISKNKPKTTTQPNTTWFEQECKVVEKKFEETLGHPVVSTHYLANEVPVNSMEDLFTKDSIRTFTGKQFNIKNIDSSMIDIEDIAHSLSQQCRFAAHLPVFYTVAQHCVLTAYHASPENKLAALLHDASEAYLLDMAKPFKDLMPDYKALENKVMEAIAEKYGFAYPLDAEIKMIDMERLEYEWNGAMLGKFYVDCWSPQKAKQKFLEMFNLLTQ